MYTCSLTAEPTTTKLFTDLSLNEREIQPNECEVCGDVYKDMLVKLLDSDSIKKQIIAHSCKSSSNSKYKCDDCEFWGPNTLTMEVHMKRVHSETISCGLCGYEAKNIESMETHQVTCET